MSRTAARIGLAAAIIALILPIIGLGTVLLLIGSAQRVDTAAPVEPFVGAPTLYAATDTEAAKQSVLARDAGNDALADLYDQYAGVPQAIWLEPDEHGLGDVGRYVADTVRSASAEQATPVFVIYGIPDRDCSNHSAGGLTEAEYPVWVREIADAMIGQDAVVILEPDSLALADDCGDRGKRLSEVSAAVDTLSARGIATYLDGGHSNWQPVAVMAELLNAAGVSKVRGFATNVSNFNTTQQEVGYGNQLSAATGGAHYVIDVSRNGNGSNGEWCNPPGRALGDDPALLLDDGDVHDANLWIKTPGESDGECNGGPAAGAWWERAAVELSRNAGW